MILTRAAATLLLLLGTAVPARAADPIPTVRRVAALTQLAAQEYRIGVSLSGQVVSQAEVDEAHLFLTEARKAAAQLPVDRAESAVREIDALLHNLSILAHPDSVDLGARRVAQALSRQFGVDLESFPSKRPSLARGRLVYTERCASCHGDAGSGDGPLAQNLNPRPADLTDLKGLSETTPLDFYRRVTYGVAGTAMPAFETQLTADDRWAVAAYASLLRLPRPSGEVPVPLQDFAAAAKRSDVAIAQDLGLTLSDAAAPARVAAVRAFEPSRGAEVAALFGRVRSEIDSALQLAALGQYDAAERMAIDAYLDFEAVEQDVRLRNPGLASELEAAFATLRHDAATAATAENTRQEAAARLRLGLERAQRAVGDSMSPVSAFVQSFVLLVREGLEAILIVGALLTFLVKTGASDRRREIHHGVAWAVVASLMTAVLIEAVFHVSPAHRETLEATVMLAATGVLFYVSYWLLSRMEVTRWTHFLERQTREALTQGSAFALAAAAFLAVYREGFETILFYKALFLSGGSEPVALPIVGGIVLGTLVLAVVYVGINRFGVRLPLRPFFAVTGVLLYVMAVIFSGRGIAALQEGGIIGLTVLGWAPRIPWLGVYPTAESLALQGILVLLFVAALAWQGREGSKKHVARVHQRGRAGGAGAGVVPPSEGRSRVPVGSGPGTAGGRQSG